MDYYNHSTGALLSEQDDDEAFEPPIDILKVKCACGHEFETINEGEFTDSTCGKCRSKLINHDYEPLF
jgi:hypothetical protein